MTIYDWSAKIVDGKEPTLEKPLPSPARAFDANGVEIDGAFNGIDTETGRCWYYAKNSDGDVFHTIDGLPIRTFVTYDAPIRVVQVGPPGELLD